MCVSPEYDQKKDKRGGIFYFSCLLRLLSMKISQVPHSEMDRVTNFAPNIGAHGGYELYGGVLAGATCTCLAFGQSK